LIVTGSIEEGENMRRAIFWAFLLILGSSALGATVFSDQIASAGSRDKPATPVLEQNVDANGNIRTHEQGTATVALSSADADRLDTANAKLDTPNGHLANIESQAAKLNFDNGNLKTAPQGTQTVHIDNSSITTSADRPNNFAFSRRVDLDAGSSAFYGTNGNFLVSLVAVGGADDSVTVNFQRPDGFSALFLYGGGLDGSDNYQLPLTTPILIDGVFVHCSNFIEDCKLSFSAVGSAP